MRNFAYLCINGLDSYGCTWIYMFFFKIWIFYVVFGRLFFFPVRSSFAFLGLIGPVRFSVLITLRLIKPLNTPSSGLACGLKWRLSILLTSPLKLNKGWWWNIMRYKWRSGHAQLKVESVVARRRESGFVMTQLETKVDLIRWKNVATKFLICLRKLSLTYSSNGGGWEDIHVVLHTY